jgi:hypothetical protein
VLEFSTEMVTAADTHRRAGAGALGPARPWPSCSICAEAAFPPAPLPEWQPVPAVEFFGQRAWPPIWPLTAAVRERSRQTLRLDAEFWLVAVTAVVIIGV